MYVLFFPLEILSRSIILKNRVPLKMVLGMEGWGGVRKQPSEQQCCHTLYKESQRKRDPDCPSFTLFYYNLFIYLFFLNVFRGNFYIFLSYYRDDDIIQWRNVIT